MAGESGGVETVAEAPRIRLLMGPGTLPSQGSGRLDFTRYRRSGRPRMTGQELLVALPEIASIARVEVDSGNPYEVATLDEVRKLAVRVNEVLQSPEVDGMVFIQGTNTLEETAYFLTLTARSRKPVVVTGAQRPFTALSSDAQINLLDAFRVAAAPEAIACSTKRARASSTSNSLWRCLPTARAMLAEDARRRLRPPSSRFVPLCLASSAHR